MINDGHPKCFCLRLLPSEICWKGQCLTCVGLLESVDNMSVNITSGPVVTLLHGIGTAKNDYGI